MNVTHALRQRRNHQNHQVYQVFSETRRFPRVQYALLSLLGFPFWLKPMFHQWFGKAPSAKDLIPAEMSDNGAMRGLYRAQRRAKDTTGWLGHASIGIARR